MSDCDPFKDIDHNDAQKLSKQDAVFIGSDCIDSDIDAQSALWLLSACSRIAHCYWLISDWLLEDLIQKDEVSLL